MKHAAIFILTLIMVLGISCANENATLIVKMTDAPLEGVEQVNVEILRIDVVKKGSPNENVPCDQIKDGDGILTVLENPEPQMINLLELVNGNTAVMGSLDLEAGEYLQLRLIVGTNNTVKFSNDSTLYPLNTPSGETTGIKLKGNAHNPLFTLESGEVVELVFDFDAALSVKTAVDKSEYKLDPVIKEIRFRNQVLSTNGGFVLEK